LLKCGGSVTHAATRGKVGTPCQLGAARRSELRIACQRQCIVAQDDLQFSGVMDDQGNTETSKEARHPWKIFDIDAQDDSMVRLFKPCFWRTRLALHFLQSRLQPHFDVPYTRDSGKRALDRFECIKVDGRRKRLARRFDLLDTVQTKEALSLSQ